MAVASEELTGLEPDLAAARELGGAAGTAADSPRAEGEPSPAVHEALSALERTLRDRRAEQPDGSYRYSTRYRTTPVWVTSQVLPALARKPFPFR